MKNGGLIQWNAVAICEMSKTSWQKGKLRMKDDLENHNKDQSRLHQFGKKVLLVIFLGYELIAGRIWKGHILIADLEDLEKLDASEFYLRRTNTREVLISQKEMISYSQQQMVQKKRQEETTNSENPL